ncbi:MAG: aminotransferase class V-fold PLP-dependent enzyme [Myxococcota bacterium]
MTVGSTTRPTLGDRGLFPNLEARAYLNHAAVSPLSSPVEAAARGVIEDMARRGVSAVPDWFAQRERLREKLAALVGADSEEIGFVQSTTKGITDLALSIPWRRGDRVVLFEGEFPGNVTPWQRAAELFQLELKWLPLAPFHRSEEEGLAALRTALVDGARMVAVSAVQFQTGLRMPLEAMGALVGEHGAEFFVDGIQALGASPIDVRRMRIDYLSTGGHKWLMGLEGAGFVVVARARADALRPYTAGWLSHEEPLKFLLEGKGHLDYSRPLAKGAKVFEGGAQNAVGYAALEASLDLILQIGIDEIAAHLQRYHDELEPVLVEHGFRSLRVPFPTGRSGALCVDVPKETTAPEVQRRLSAEGIATTTPDGFLRFSPHWPNAIDEVSRIRAALESLPGSE